MSEAKIIRFSHGKIEMETSHYNPDFVEELKELVPWSLCHWSRERKRYVVDSQAVVTVKGLLEKHFDFVNEVLG